MSRRLLAGLWVVVGVAVWNGFLDLYVSRGAREYGQKQAEAELHLGPPVSMVKVMADARQDGIVAGTLWAVLVIGSGWVTIWLSAPSRESSASRPAPRTGG